MLKWAVIEAYVKCRSLDAFVWYPAVSCINIDLIKQISLLKKRIIKALLISFISFFFSYLTQVSRSYKHYKKTD